MTTQHRASVITWPPVAGAVLFGIGGYAFVYALTVDAVWSLIGVGLGIPGGFLLVALLWWHIYERWTNPQATGREVRVKSVDVKPVEVIWRDNGGGILSRQVLRSVSMNELREVATKVINHGSSLTFRGLRSVLPDTTIANLQNELVAKRLAEWRSYDKRTNQPNRNRGIRLTEKGHRLMVEALRPSPTPTGRIA